MVAPPFLSLATPYLTFVSRYYVPTYIQIQIREKYIQFLIATGSLATVCFFRITKHIYNMHIYTFYPTPLFPTAQLPDIHSYSQASYTPCIICIFPVYARNFLRFFPRFKGLPHHTYTQAPREWNAGDKYDDHKRLATHLSLENVLKSYMRVPKKKN